jgi:3-dehydroquinate synthase
MKNEMNRYNLVLTGFMGTGKTTIGKRLAERLGREFVDTDDLIVQRIGKSIPQIFADYGEPFFRAIEASLCVELGTPQGLVIATGGGTLVQEDNLRAIQGGGNMVFCLKAAPEVILARLDHDPTERPLVDSQGDRLGAIRNLLEKRREAYRRIRLQVTTDQRDVEDITDEILAQFEQETAHNAIRIPVISPTNSYDILCEPGLLDQLPDILKAYHLTGRVIVTTNTTLAPLYGERLVGCLPNAALVTMNDGEQYKTISTVERLYTDFAAAGLDRGGLVIALGGGVVGDTVGYAAATYMRGVPLVQIPTSLLAMVDSSVGGKVGVDIPEGKNLVGAFKQPELVLIDPFVLQTLPEVEIRCGLAEAIKHGLIGNPGLLERIEDIAGGDAQALRQTIQVKVDVVQRDPYEQGERAHLNFGHTFAHAIERVSGYRWRHGEAVSVGLVAAARLSAKLGMLTTDQVSLITNLLLEVGLPTTMTGFDSEALWQAMHTDKKWRDGHSQFVILEDIGKPKLIRDVPREVVIDVLDSLKE